MNGAGPLICKFPSASTTLETATPIPSLHPPPPPLSMQHEDDKDEDLYADPLPFNEQ